MKYGELVTHVSKPYFTRTDLRLHRLQVYDYQLSLWKKQGKLEQLKRGVYVFAQKRDELSPHEVSQLLYQPSYISLESALSYYGLIPEMVFAHTAVTTKATRSFENCYGRFTYRSIKPELYFGYQAHTTKHGVALLAEPEKALLDHLYLLPARQRTPEGLLALRINTELLCETLDATKLQQYCAVYRSPSITKAVLSLLAQC